MTAGIATTVERGKLQLRENVFCLLFESRQYQALPSSIKHSTPTNKPNNDTKTANFHGHGGNYLSDNVPLKAIDWEKKRTLT